MERKTLQQLSLELTDIVHNCCADWSERHSYITKFLEQSYNIGYKDGYYSGYDSIVKPNAP